MQTSIEALSRLERRLNMAVPAEQIDREVEQRLRKLSRTVRMDGFRPGKVPLKIVAQHYGPQVRSEVIGDAVQKAFSEVVQEQKLKVAGYPRIERKEGGDGKQLTFSATFEIYPEVKLGDLSATTIQRPTHAVEDADVDRTVEILRKQRASWEGVTRASESGDRVTVDFTGRIDGNGFPGGTGIGVAVVLGEGRMLPEFESGLTGVSAGERKTFPVVFPAGYPGKEIAGKSADFEVSVQKVEMQKLPAIDAEFARGNRDAAHGAADARGSGSTRRQAGKTAREARGARGPGAAARDAGTHPRRARQIARARRQARAGARAGDRARPDLRTALRSGKMGLFGAAAFERIRG